MPDTLKIPEIDTRGPMAEPTSAYLRLPLRSEQEVAAERIRTSWARMGLLLAEVADELDQLLCDEDAVSGMSVVRHERLHNLLERVRRT